MTRYPHEFSGGMRQRAALLRTMVNNPQVFLLDEPLGALDLKLRKEMQQELKYIQQEVGITFIFVTHDQEEALTMSDKIVVMNAGEIQQIGTPTEIYRTPVNEFVAKFIGETNIIDGVMLRTTSSCSRTRSTPAVPAATISGQGLCQKRERGRRHPPRAPRHCPACRGYAQGHGQVSAFQGHAL